MIVSFVRAGDFSIFVVENFTACCTTLSAGDGDISIGDTSGFGLYCMLYNLSFPLSAGAGDFSIWDFSGYEPYYMLYDHFLGDTNCLHLVTFSLQDTPDEQLAQVIFWLNFLKARVPPAMPIGQLMKNQKWFLLFVFDTVVIVVNFYRQYSIRK